jgi:CBS domain containing-hemolysin-like protein
LTWWIVVLIVLSFVSLIMSSALHGALQSSSDGALERQLAKRGRLERSRWLIGRQDELASYMAVKRVGCMIILVALLVIELGMVAGFCTGAVLVWLAIDLIAPAIAHYTGQAMIIGLAAPLRLALVISKPIHMVNRLFDETVRRLSGANLRERDAEEDLLRSIEETQRQGGLDDVAAEMLENVVEFADTDVSSVMTPRTEIEGIEYTDDLVAIRAFIEDAGHSRIPVYRDSLDEIEGILYVKDLIRYLGATAPNFKLSAVLRESVRIPETKHVGDLLRDFQTAEIHMAIVIDEYGGTSGLITIEDVLEEIVGEIHDEHEPDDEEEPTCSLVGPDHWKADGRFAVNDLEDQLEIDFPEEIEPETVAGLVLEHFGRVPEPDEHFDAYGFRFRVLESSETRVESVGIRRLGADEIASPAEARSA